MSGKNVSRRSFMRAGGAGLSVAPFSRILGANDAVRLAVVGVGSTVKIGGKGKVDAREFARIPGVRIAAFCDVDRANLDPEVQKWRDRGEKVEAYTDVRKLLENKDIDAVSVTTPNHWHALVTIWACQAGKDVFVQKPASHNMFEGRKMIEAARKYNRMVQCPSNARSPNGFQEAAAWAWAGNLGKIRFIHGVNFGARTSIGKVSGPQTIPSTIDYDMWSGPAPVLPLMRENLHYDWHWQWPYGGGELGNWGPHILDGCRLAIHQRSLPRHVIAMGGRFAYKDDGETPNSMLMYYDYEPAPIIFEIRGLPKDRSLLSTVWSKDQNASMDTYRGIRQGTVIQCEGGYIAQNKAFDRDGSLIRQFTPTTPNLNVNFVEAVRSRRREDLVAEIAEGHLSVGLIHMANISYRVGKAMPAAEVKERIEGSKELVNAYERFKAHLAANDVEVDKMIAGPMLTMDGARERFTGDASGAANQLLTREYRKPYVVPEKV
jgi:predicted dehydrogenase